MGTSYDVMSQFSWRFCRIHNRAHFSGFSATSNTRLILRCAAYLSQTQQGASINNMTLLQVKHNSDLFDIDYLNAQFAPFMLHVISFGICRSLVSSVLRAHASNPSSNVPNKAKYENKLFLLISFYQQSFKKKTLRVNKIAIKCFRKLSSFGVDVKM